MKCPCKGCDDTGCGSYHDICPKYKKWREWKDSVNKAKANDSELKAISRNHELKYRKNLKAGWKNK